MFKRDPASLCIALLGVGVLAAGIMLPTHIKGAQAAQSSNTGSPLVTTGVPAPMLYGQTDPVTANQPCAGDPSRMGIPYYNMGSGIARPIWICNGTNWIQAQSAISGTSVSIGGALLLLGSSVSGTATVTGAAVGSNCIATRADGTLLPVGLVIDCAVSTANTATVRISALIAGTPSAGIYSVRVIN